MGAMLHYVFTVYATKIRYYMHIDVSVVGVWGVIDVIRVKIALSKNGKEEIEEKIVEI